MLILVLALGHPPGPVIIRPSHPSVPPISLSLCAMVIAGMRVIAGALLRSPRTPASFCTAARPSAALSPSPILASFERALAKEAGLLQGQLLVVSVSGGADSVALLRLLLAVQSNWNFRLHVLHFNHGLRFESEEEVTFEKNESFPHSH